MKYKIYQDDYVTEVEADSDDEAIAIALQEEKITIFRTEDGKQLLEEYYN